MSVDELQGKLLDEIGAGCRDQEDLVLCFESHDGDSVLTALDRLEQRGKLNSNAQSGHKSYAKPGNEPWPGVDQ